MGEMSSSNRTNDGFICYADGTLENGLRTIADNNLTKIVTNKEYDVIIVGAGFAGLVAARELSCRGRQVLLVEARDRIGGRTFTAQVDNQQFELGGAWIHWRQPHIWAEMTRYGLSLSESDGGVPDYISVLLDNGSKLKTVSLTDLHPKLSKILDKFSDVDGFQGKTIFPFPHAPLTAREAIQAYDHLTMYDRLNQISNLFEDDEEMPSILDAYLSVNSQGDIAESGFLDYLGFCALGDNDTILIWDKGARYKIREGTNALAQAILDDCENLDLLLSTPVSSIHRTADKSVIIQGQDGRRFTARAAIITASLNALNTLRFEPELEFEKKRAIAEGQCRGGNKFWVKLEQSVGHWCGFAPYPSPITVAFTDDTDGTIIIGFGPDNVLDIQDVQAVEQALQKFLPHCKVKYVLGHDWRSDPYIQGTWSWYKPRQISSNLAALQRPEPPLFFASGDAASSWRGCINGAFESGLTSVYQVQKYLDK